jgi:BNR repeat-like domain
MGAGTYPRANFLADGSILGAYTAFSDGNNIITLASSTDSGKTWTVVGTAATEPSAGNDLDNPYPLQLPSGRILITFRNHSKDANNNYTMYRITVCYSDDNGVTWTFLSTPAQNPGPNFNGLWEPMLRVAGDGSVQIYYSHELDATNQVNLMQVSTDGGATWGAPATVSSKTNARDGMTGVTNVSGSNLIAVFESGFNGQFTVNSVTSSDDGVTWGNRQPVYTATGDNNNAGSPQVANVGGTLVCSFMTDEDTSEHSWVNGANAKLLTSADGGATWGNKLMWSDVQSNWPGLLTLTSTSFLGMADYNGAKAQEIVLG